MIWPLARFHTPDSTLAFLAALVILLFGQAAQIRAADSNPGPAAASAPRTIYARAAEPAVSPALLPLPPGAVEPSGWLRDWAQAARDGITGHLDERHPVFSDGWKGSRVNAPNAKADGTGWPLEQSAYWLDGALRLGFVLHDETLIRKIRARLDPIVDGVNQAPAGTSFIYWKPDYKPAGFDSWAHSHMGRALVALYDATREQRVLDALVKVYASYTSPMGGLELGGEVSGLCNLDPMLETYSFSGDRRILERALQAMAQPAVMRSIEAWQQERLQPGHMVILYENIRLPAVLYPWSGDPRDLEATAGAFRWLDTNHMLPYGVASGEEFASGVGAFRKTETCDLPAMLLATSWMYRIEGTSAWGDRMERAFFNAGPAAVARDFQTMCYYQSPNRLRSDSLPIEQPFCPGPPNTRFTSLGCSNVLCCVGALNRVIPNFIIHMWTATPDNGLAAALYGPCSVSARVGADVPVKIDSATDYPFREGIRLEIKPAATVSFPLYLRIPGWCERPEIALNGSPLPTPTNAKGFVKLARTWSKGDIVQVRFPMRPQVLRGYETEFPSANREYFRFEPPEVFQPRRLPYASVVYGPLLFALPIPDTDPNNPVPNVRWQFALDTEAAAGPAGLKVETRPMPAHWDWPLAAPLAIQVPARAFDWQPTDAQALPSEPITGGASQAITLIPYGCTKFRISMFPVATAKPETWANASSIRLFGGAGESNVIRVQFREVDTLFANPGQGWMSQQRSPRGEPRFPCSVVYIRFNWADAEPEEGAFNWRLIDDVIAAWKSSGAAVAMRVMTCNAHSSGYYSSPKWLFDAGGKGFEYLVGGDDPTSGGKRVPRIEPDYADPIYLEKHGAFLRALGQRYDGRPDVEFLDIGSYGVWGEWHTQHPAPVAVRQQIVDLYLRAFRKTPLVFMSDDAEVLNYALAHGTGFRRDGVGSPWHEQNWIGSKKYAGVAGMAETWKNAPVVLEWFGDYAYLQSRQWSFDAAVDFMLQNHVTLINDNIGRVPPEAMPQLEKLARLAGARFILRELAHEKTVQRGAPLKLQMKWSNVGVGKLHHPYVLRLYLLDGTNKPVFSADAKVDPRGWLPGDHSVTESIPIPAALDRGEYVIALALVDPAAHRRPWRLAIAAPENDGRYEISKVKVE